MFTLTSAVAKIVTRPAEFLPAGFEQPWHDFAGKLAKITGPVMALKT